MPRESKAARLKRMHDEYAVLCQVFPEPKCALDFDSPFQLVVATVLSAQTTDRRVNTVTPTLFAQYPTAAALAAADPQRVEDIIRPIGFYHAKTRNIIALAAQLESRFHGQVPDTMDELVTLPGVGRKTANVVLGDAFDVPGLPVDTHVKRLVRLIGLVRQEDPVKIEAELCAHLDPGRWSQFSHLLIVHGRTVCKANRPACEGCVLQTICKYGKKHVVQK